MRNIAIAGVVVSLLAGAAVFAWDDTPKPTAPEKEHAWLKQFVGEWETETEAVVEPGKPPQKCHGTETARMIGGIWMLSEGQGTVFEVPMQSVLTLGYDAKKKKYVGTWIDSMHNHLWKYEGTVDETGKVLTLDTEGPNMADPTKTAKYRDVFEFKSNDHRVLTSSVQGDDGKWVAFMTANSRRKN